MKSMIDLEKNHLIVGFGATGLSIAHALQSLAVKNLWALDSRANPPHLDEMQAICSEVRYGAFDQELLNKCDYLWISPGIPLATEALQDCLARLPKSHIGGDIELFAQLVSLTNACVIGNASIVGITGTNGKSTVTTLVADIFKAAGKAVYVGGNLGDPALDLWRASTEDRVENPFFILELSSFQLETTHSLSMKVGAILNIAPDHLDRYESFDAYAKAKFKIFAQSTNWVSNADDPLLNSYIKASPSQKGEVITFSIEDLLASKNKESDNNHWRIIKDHDDQQSITNGTFIMNTRDIPMGGLHNIANVMAASAIAKICAIPEQIIKGAITAYKPLPHRCVLVRTVKGVRYYDDSKATNLPSTAAAIKGFTEPKWLILGGVTKDQDFSSLASILDQSIKRVLLIGEDISQIMPHIPEDIPHLYVHTLDNALSQIYTDAVSGDIVLFSPACASFDQFKDYNHRGECFTKKVKALID